MRTSALEFYFLCTCIALSTLCVNHKLSVYVPTCVLFFSHFIKHCYPGNKFMFKK